MNTSLSRVEYWQKLIEDSSLGDTERKYLRDHLRDLVNAANIQVKHLDSNRSDEANENSSLPTSAQKFLYPPKGKNGKGSIFHQLNFFFLAPKWLRRCVRKTFYKDYSMIDQIIKSMEKQLEISNEK
jgi:hypothetical protein